jgi:hypothetical protein
MGFRKDYLDVGAKPAAEKVRTAVRSARDAWPPHKHQQRPCSISVQSLLQLERSTRLSGQEEVAQTEVTHLSWRAWSRLRGGRPRVGSHPSTQNVSRGHSVSNSDACMQDVVTHQKPLPDDSGSGL